MVETVNREMERYSHQAKNLGFIDLNPVLFDKKGNVRMELFLPDELHFCAARVLTTAPGSKHTLDRNSKEFT